jgi:hypothetical protein
MRDAVAGVCWSHAGRWSLAVLVTLLAWEARSEARPAARITVQLSGPAGLDPESLQRARMTVRGVLARAGIELRWEDCHRRPCKSSDPHMVRLLLLPIAKDADGHVCGEVLRSRRSPHPSIVVYMRRLLDVQEDLRRTARDHPALRSLSFGDLMGLTIAHEIGHALGLAHSTAGIMVARPAVAELVALAASRLEFTGNDATRMRLALARPPDAVVATR